METLDLALGVREYTIPGGGTLRFNPTDPNLYANFLDSQKRLEQIRKDLQKQAKSAADGAQVLGLLQEADRQLKALLGEIFPSSAFSCRSAS